MITRDEVWDAVLHELWSTGSFTQRDLGFDESKRQTVRRVLKDMEDLGWLRKDDPRSATWRPGELAAKNVDLPDGER